MSYTVLYIAWAVMFAVTAGLGFVPAEGGMEHIMMLAAGAFFLPPWAILQKAMKEGAQKHKNTIRNLCLLSVGATVAVMALNILSANWGEAVGQMLYNALVIVSAPMICGQTYVLSLFMWGILLMGSVSKTNTGHS